MFCLCFLMFHALCNIYDPEGVYVKQVMVSFECIPEMRKKILQTVPTYSLASLRFNLSDSETNKTLYVDAHIIPQQTPSLDFFG